MNKKFKFIPLYISIGSFFLMSAMFLLIPIDFAAYNLGFLNLLVGLMFWAFLILGILIQVVLMRARRYWFVKNHIRRNLFRGNLGVISFFQNIPACIADGCLGLSLIGLIISTIATDAFGYVCYVFTGLTVFSFCMHCILNGKVYYLLTHQDELLKASQPRHSEKEEKR